MIAGEIWTQPVSAILDGLRLIQRFMLVLGPVSSLFDFLTFYVLFHLFKAGEALFQTGWFVESLATQVLVIFVIRTRHRPWHSRPHPVLAGLTLGGAAIGALLPLTPLGAFFGFVPPPVSFYVFLAAAVLAYLMLVELVLPVHGVRATPRLFRGRPPRKPDERTISNGTPPSGKELRTWRTPSRRPWRLPASCWALRRASCSHRSSPCRSLWSR
jgi:hypothetical protein